MSRVGGGLSQLRSRAHQHRCQTASKSSRMSSRLHTQPHPPQPQPHLLARPHPPQSRRTFFLQTLPNGPFKGHQIRYELALVW